MERLLAIIAIVAALGAWYVAYYTVVIGIYFQLLQMYSSPEMSKALRLLSNWEKADSSEYERFAKAHSNGFRDDSKLVEVDNARRYVEHYFNNAHRIFKKFWRVGKYRDEIIRLYGIRLYFVVIERMEKAMGEVAGEEYNSDNFNEIYKIAQKIKPKIEPKLIRPCADEQ